MFIAGRNLVMLLCVSRRKKIARNFNSRDKFAQMTLVTRLEGNGIQAIDELKRSVTHISHLIYVCCAWFIDTATFVNISISNKPVGYLGQPKPPNYFNFCSRRSTIVPFPRLHGTYFGSLQFEYKCPISACFKYQIVWNMTPCMKIAVGAFFKNANFVKYILKEKTTTTKIPN